MYWGSKQHLEMVPRPLYRFPTAIGTAWLPKPEYPVYILNALHPFPALYHRCVHLAVFTAITSAQAARCAAHFLTVVSTSRHSSL